MPRGCDFYGPGFWKGGTGWVPGSGGFRGGARWGHPRPGWGWWGPCHWWGPPGAWPAHPYSPAPDRQEEIGMLQYRAQELEEELQEVRKRLQELEGEAQSNEDEEDEI